MLTTEEVKEALKNGKSYGEENLNYGIYKYAVDSFHESLLFF